jgi:diketogulonate reductase-like aldo/keto reductase
MEEVYATGTYLRPSMLIFYELTSAHSKPGPTIFSGKVKAIGVSNWSIPYLKQLEETWKIVPAVNQVELHPYNPQHELKEYCESKGILLEAYCPLGSTSELKPTR